MREATVTAEGLTRGPLPKGRAGLPALPEQFAVAERQLAAARHRRREANLKLRQPTLPLETSEVVANDGPKMSQSG